MIYLDSATIVKLVHAEPESPALCRWLDKRAETGWISSVLTEIESFRALARYAPEAVSRLPAVLDQIDLDQRIRILARTVQPVTVRSLDAIHLGAALQSRPGLTSFVTYDSCGRLIERDRSAIGRVRHLAWHGDLALGDLVGRVDHGKSMSAWTSFCSRSFWTMGITVSLLPAGPIIPVPCAARDRPGFGKYVRDADVGDVPPARAAKLTSRRLLRSRVAMRRTVRVRALLAGSAGYSPAGVHTGRYWLVAAMAVSLSRSQMLTRTITMGRARSSRPVPNAARCAQAGPRRNPRLYMVRARAAPRVMRMSHPPAGGMCGVGEEQRSGQGGLQADPEPRHPRQRLGNCGRRSLVGLRHVHEAAELWLLMNTGWCAVFVLPARAPVRLALLPAPEVWDGRSPVCPSTHAPIRHRATCFQASRASEVISTTASRTAW